MAALDLDQAGFHASLGRAHRSSGLGIVTTAVHKGINGDPMTAIDNVHRLVYDLQHR